MPDGRIRLGELRSTSVAPVTAIESDSDREAAGHELYRANAHIVELELALQTSRREAQESIAELRALRVSVEAERAAAQERGYLAGLEKAEAAAHLEAQQHAREWQRSAEELLREIDARWQTLRADLTEVVLASTIKVIGEQLAHPQFIRAAVEQAMRESAIGAPLRVLIAPSQYELLMKSGGGPLTWFKERRMELAPDPRVTHGGCLLETAEGWIDARFETQLVKLRDIVAAHYAGASR
jgi:flagellar assembly protein FliH